MPARKTLLAAFLLIVAAVATPVLSASVHTDQQAATTHYDHGDYANAYKKYLRLAKKGDTFSQYRVSYMNLRGQGTEVNLVESVAWAVVAAKTGHADLRRYQHTVAAMVPADDRKKAQAKADYYVRRWGREDKNDKAGAPGRSAQGRCTGSRLAASCDEGPDGSSGAWISWGAVVAPPEELRSRVEELNQAIVENAHHIGAGSTGK